MAKKFDFSDTTVSKEEAEKRLESLGLAQTKKGPVSTAETSEQKPTEKEQPTGSEKHSRTKPLKKKDSVETKPLHVKKPARYRGVPEGYIRFSYIVREDFHEIMRAIAKEKGVSIRQIMDKALEKTVGQYQDKYKRLPDRDEEMRKKEKAIEKLF